MLILTINSVTFPITVLLIYHSDTMSVSEYIEYNILAAGCYHNLNQNIVEELIAVTIFCINTIMLLERKSFFTDECAIYAEGRSKVCMSFLSKENPFFWDQVKQHPPFLIVWAAVSARHLIGSFFLRGPVTAENYIAKLRDEFISNLQPIFYFCPTCNNMELQPILLWEQDNSWMATSKIDWWVSLALILVQQEALIYNMW